MPALTLAALQELVTGEIDAQTALLLPVDDGCEPEVDPMDPGNANTTGPKRVKNGFFEAVNSNSIPFKISKYKWVSTTDEEMDLEITGFFYPGSEAPAVTGNDDPNWTEPGDADDWEIDTAKNLRDNQPLSDEDLESFSNDEATTPRFAKVLYKLLPKNEGLDESSKVQTLIFAKDLFKKDEAETWAKKHDFEVSKVDEKDETFRIRQEDPSKFGKMRTIQFGPGIKAVVGWGKGEKQEGIQEDDEPNYKSGDKFLPAEDGEVTAQQAAKVSNLWNDAVKAMHALQHELQVMDAKSPAGASKRKVSKAMEAVKKVSKQVTDLHNAYLIL